MLTLGYIHPGTVREEFSQSVLQAVVGDLQERRIISGILSVPTSIIAHGRNALCHQFLQTENEWLLMVDTDIIFTLNDIYALLDAGLPVIGGLYLMRHSDPLPCWTSEGFQQILDIPPAPMRVNTVGTGFLLIERWVLEKLRAERPEEPWAWFGNDLILGTRAGEDVSFCDRLNRLDIPVHGHGAVQVGHVGTTLLYPSDHTIKEQ